jgi:hypothetical protein
MLLRLVSLFPFSLSPPLAGGNRAVLLGVILLILDSCDLLVFQTLRALVSCDLAPFLDSCGLPDSCRFPDFLVSQIHHGFVVFYASCSLPDSCSLLESCGLPDSCGLTNSCGLQTLKAVTFVLKTLTTFKRERVHNCLYTYMLKTE